MKSPELLFKYLPIVTWTAVLSVLPCVQGLSQQQTAANANVAAEHQQEVHSRLFRGQSSETIPELLSKTSGDIHVEYNQAPGFTSAPLNAPAYPPYPLVAFACTSDAVIVATAQSGVPHLTSDQRFVYTDWTFNVEQVLKADPESGISPGATLIVTRSGGTLQVNGRRVIATDAGFRDFKAAGRYLLFLESIPETRAYKATAEKSFSLETNSVRSLATYNPPGFEPKSAELLLRDTNAAVAAQTSGCSGSSRGRHKSQGKQTDTETKTANHPPLATASLRRRTGQKQFLPLINADER